MNSEIRLLKLTNGEDIIAYVNETPESYHLDNPLVMKVHSRMTPKEKVSSAISDYKKKL